VFSDPQSEIKAIATLVKKKKKELILLMYLAKSKPRGNYWTRHPSVSIGWSH
jgi:hypothetical protein